MSPIRRAARFGSRSKQKWPKQKCGRWTTAVFRFQANRAWTPGEPRTQRRALGNASISRQHRPGRPGHAEEPAQSTRPIARQGVASRAVRGQRRAASLAGSEPSAAAQRRARRAGRRDGEWVPRAERQGTRGPKAAAGAAMATGQRVLGPSKRFTSAPAHTRTHAHAQAQRGQRGWGPRSGPRSRARVQKLSQAGLLSSGSIARRGGPNTATRHAPLPHGRMPPPRRRRPIREHSASPPRRHVVRLHGAAGSRPRYAVTRGCLVRRG